MSTAILLASIIYYKKGFNILLALLCMDGLFKAVNVLMRPFLSHLNTVT